MYSLYRAWLSNSFLLNSNAAASESLGVGGGYCSNNADVLCGNLSGGIVQQNNGKDDKNYEKAAAAEDEECKSKETSSVDESDLRRLLPLDLTRPGAAGASGNEPGTATATVPDVHLQVGPTMTRFSAHRNVLSAHSGFFKAALNSYSANNGPITVANINVDEFSSLLTFMYTGLLDLNLGNIYSILLATHILHMPQALEICRSFLAAHQPQPQPQQQQLQHCISFASATTATSGNVASTPSAPNEKSALQVVVKPIPLLSTAAIRVHQSEASTSTVATSVAFKSTSSSSGNNFLNAKRRTGSVFKRVKSSTSGEAEASEASKPSGRKLQKAANNDSSGNRGNSANNANNGNAANAKVVIDVACCDGPVRFHRVVNENYGLETAEQQMEEPACAVAAMNKAMSAHMRLAADENGGGGGGGNAETLYTCRYCNHTFKSQYCFQKHARRHLNPLTQQSQTKAPEATVPENGHSGVATNAKREVRLLDMNVQYYPCKTCGSKFPSYYFVHKHRKLCHPEEMAAKGTAVAAAGGGAGELQVSADEGHSNSSGKSIIDVVHGE